MTLVLAGNLTIDDVDVNDVVHEMRVGGTRDQIEIPPTVGAPHWRAAAGAGRWWVEIASTADPAVGSLNAMLWDAINSPGGHLDFAGTVARGPISDDNPLWTGTLVVTDWSIGGEVGQAMEHSARFGLVGPPSRLTSDPEES